jgi:hypothetical protein
VAFAEPGKPIRGPSRVVDESVPPLDSRVLEFPVEALKGLPRVEARVETATDDVYISNPLETSM